MKEKPDAADAAETSVSFATPIDGLRAALPIVVAYVPLGMAAGVVGAQAGLSAAEVLLLSLLVFAGVSQFIFADMLGGAPSAGAGASSAGSGAAPAVIVATVFLVNFRHFLYAAALIPKFKHLALAKRAAIGAQLTDEGFALISLLYKKRHGAAGVIAFNLSAYFAWALGNLLGAVIGGSGELAHIGADYLLIALFAALLMLKILAAARAGRGARATRTAALPAALTVLCAAAVFSILLELYTPSPLNLFIAAGSAAALAVFIFGAGAAEEAGAEESGAEEAAAVAEEEKAR